ncbi:hypothetical protein L1987_51434 [Smallanthus sonchifolius]|uniref:Uncharacterized protein n=1 Tax=Smallanthus sonchifolius TaxID=185202 RepID=A0ACB9EQ95_9ASTR|nr:hypothetical protein L1987_51434 [Smallanthus sonchifolius]
MCFPVLWCQKTRPYDLCHQSVWCGDIEFEYPFWGLDRPDYCGHPGFQLTCRSATSAATLLLESVDYLVLDIDSSTNMITIARNDLWSNSCPRNFFNTTLFNGNNFGQEDVSLYYGCQNLISGGIPAIANHRFDCDVNGAGLSDSYFFRTGFIAPKFNISLVQCNNYIIVPVDQSQANGLASVNASERDLRSALTAGFKLQWMANNDECDQCVRSDGRCGSNSTSPELFACYCASGNFPLTCNNSNVNGGGSKRTNLKLMIGISCSITGIMFLLFVILCRKLRSHVTPKGPEAANDQIEIFIRNYGRYMAPEVYFRCLGGTSHKSDVYSYGMMVLEMTGARKHNNARRTSTSEEYFPDWIYKQVETDPSDRPSITKVVEMLEGSFQSLQVPPKRFESSPARHFQGTLPSFTRGTGGEGVSTMERKAKKSTEMTQKLIRNSKQGESDYQLTNLTKICINSITLRPAHVWISSILNYRRFTANDMDVSVEARNNCNAEIPYSSLTASYGSGYITMDKYFGLQDAPRDEMIKAVDQNNVTSLCEYQIKHKDYDIFCGCNRGMDKFIADNNDSTESHLLPLYFSVSLGCYGLLVVGVGLMQFPTCLQEAVMLQERSGSIYRCGDINFL